MGKVNAALTGKKINKWCNELNLIDLIKKLLIIFCTLVNHLPSCSGFSFFAAKNETKRAAFANFTPRTEKLATLFFGLPLKN
ncbi:MAG: hypothetical protein IPO92_08740 [Saprospiraceae bacterium]|nr:hypothetical protein [Saprospiraceae bacterium]